MWKNDIMFRLEVGDASSRAAFPSMTTEYILTSYKEVEKEVTGFCDSVIVWTANCDANMECFMGFIQ